MKTIVDTKKIQSANLLALWRDSILRARAQISHRLPKGRGTEKACLFLGKMAGFFARHQPPEVLSRSFGVGSDEVFGCWDWIVSEHPVPGRESLRAGKRLLDYFEFLRVQRVRHLDVFLSGGASSMLWLASGKWENTQKEAKEFSRRGWTIARLNQARSRLCALKAGGAARMLSLLAPETRARVWVVSDVEPHPLSTVGSGPFWPSHIIHREVFSNTDWRRIWKRQFTSRGIGILNEGWKNFTVPSLAAEGIAREVRRGISAGKRGVLIYGCEPNLEVPARAGSGGRLSHFGLELALRLNQELREKRVSFLCATSDGRDGNSGLSAFQIKQALPPRSVRESLRDFSSGRYLRQALPRSCRVEARNTGFNVQDLIVIRVN